jgi:dihydroorotate dehydrogenase (fumarate)
MDLSTSYMGFHLENPLVPGASPMCNDLLFLRRLEDAGAPMIVMHSVFQEQFDLEEMAVNRSIESTEATNAEALSYLPNPHLFRLGPEEYLDRVAEIKRAVRIPVVASLNGRTIGGWVEYAARIEKAGADALELNIYNPALDMETSGSEIESRTIELVRAVRKTVKIPLAAKLSQNYTAFPRFAKRLCEAGANAVVLFNRFYQPDIDIHNLDMRRELTLSNSGELLPRLRYAAAVSGRIAGDVAITGGVHTAEDVIKATMVGADIVQMVSALLEHGPLYIKRLRTDIANWLEAHEYTSLAQMRGSMSLSRTPDPSAFERGNYMKILQAWEPT